MYFAKILPRNEIRGLYFDETIGMKSNDSNEVTNFTYFVSSLVMQLPVKAKFYTPELDNYC